MDTLNQRMNDMIRRAAGRLPPVTGSERPLSGTREDLDYFILTGKERPIVQDMGSADGGAGQGQPAHRPIDMNQAIRDARLRLGSM
jgi:hypothetical protein